MKRIVWLAATLLSPLLAFAAPEVPSTTGSWLINGDVMGTPVKIICKIVEKSQKLTGSCAGAADNYTPHDVAGKVKDKTVDIAFQTDVQGTPITLSIRGTLTEDLQKMNGELDVEPMGVGGQFVALREPNDPPTTAPTIAQAIAPQAPPAPASPSAMPTAVGSWKVDGDVQSNPVNVICTITEKDHKLTGTCAGLNGDNKSTPLDGETKENSVTWSFGSVYQGTPITVAFDGKLVDDGAAMQGSITVPEFQVNGSFTAKRVLPKQN
jgi:hypothetical protein